MNEAIGTLSESVGDDAPSFDEVRSKIEARYAKAKGVAELTGGTSTADTAMLEIEAAARANETKERLNQIREQLGVTVAPTAAIGQDASPAVGTAATAAIGPAPQAIGPVPQLQSTESESAQAPSADNPSD